MLLMTIPKVVQRGNILFLAAHNEDDKTLSVRNIDPPLFPAILHYFLQLYTCTCTFYVTGRSDAVILRFFVLLVVR